MSVGQVLSARGDLVSAKQSCGRTKTSASAQSAMADATEAKVSLAHGRGSERSADQMDVAAKRMDSIATPGVEVDGDLGR